MRRRHSSPRDLLAAVQESPYRLTTAEQFLEFEKNVDCFVLEPHVRTLEDLGWEYLEEKLTIGLTDDLRGHEYHGEAQGDDR